MGLNFRLSKHLLKFQLCAAASLISSTALAQTWTDFQVGGTTRKALVYVPDGLEKPPLLLSFHGMGIGAGWNQGGMMKFESIADREKFIVVYPEADQNLRWDLGGSHDIDFVLKIIEDMSSQHDIDQNRVYASGFSMGGMFSYTLACKIPDKIAAIAPGNGYPLGGLSGCVEPRAVPIFHMHGTADDFVKYSGIHSFLGSQLDDYGCPDTPVKTAPYPANKPNSKSFTEHWGPCTNSSGLQSEITLVSVAGMIHDWATAGKANTNEDPEFNGLPFDIDGSEEAWAFLKEHSLTGREPGESDPEPVDPTPGTGGEAGASGGATSSTGGATALTGGSSGVDDVPASTGGDGSGLPAQPTGGAGVGEEGQPADAGGCSVGVAASSRSGSGSWALLVLACLTLWRTSSHRHLRITRR